MHATRRLRHLIAQKSIIMAPGCHDALGAFFIQRAGFEAAYMTGYGVACSLLGRPDLGELTMTEMVSQASRIAAANQSCLQLRPPGPIPWPHSPS